MKSIAIITFMCLWVITGWAQSVNIEDEPKKSHRIWVTGYQIELDGTLYDVTDSSILILTNHQEVQNIDVIEVKVKDVTKLKLRGPNKVKIGAVLGFISMAVVGGMFVHFAAEAGDDTAEPGDIIWFGLVTGAVGAGIGAGIATGKKVYRINGDLVRYKTKYRDELKSKVAK